MTHTHLFVSFRGTCKILFMSMPISKLCRSRLRAFLVSMAYIKDHQLTNQFDLYVFQNCLKLLVAII